MAERRARDPLRPEAPGPTSAAREVDPEGRLRVLALEQERWRQEGRRQRAAPSQLNANQINRGRRIRAATPERLFT